METRDFGHSKNGVVLGEPTGCFVAFGGPLKTQAPQDGPGCVQVERTGDNDANANTATRRCGWRAQTRETTHNNHEFLCKGWGCSHALCTAKKNVKGREISLASRLVAF